MMGAKTKPIRKSGGTTKGPKMTGNQGMKGTKTTKQVGSMKK